MPSRTHRSSKAWVGAIAALIQITLWAAEPSPWASPEVTGGSAEQRQILRDRVAAALANAKVFDRELLVGICNGVRRDFSPNATCGLVVEKHSGQHYLVEIPPQEPARRRDAGDFADPSELRADDLHFATVLESRFGAALMDETAVDVPLKDARPNVGGLDQGTIRDAILISQQLDGELSRLVRGASRAEVRRGAATLLGWSGKPDATLAALEPAMADPDEGVRNTVSLNAAMVVPAASTAMRQRWSALWCKEMANGSYTDRTKALLGLARLSQLGTQVRHESCVKDVRSYANETAMPSLKALAQIIMER